MRDLEITTVTDTDELSEGWKEVIGDRTFVSGTACQFDVAEEVISLLTFEDSIGTYTVPEYEVGMGEAMRPYHLLYKGNDKVMAHQAFWAAVQKSAEY